MRTSQIEIYTHDSEVDVAHKINTMELENWINHLTYMRQEMNNFLEFYKMQNSTPNLANENIIQGFQLKQVDNDVILSSLIQFKNSRGTVIECEDLACDMVFIQEHEKCRRIYLFHIEKYRKLKDEFFKKLQGKFSTLKKTAQA